MRAITEMPQQVAASITVVLADIDDTITTDGRLTAEAYTALENLHKAGIRVAPVTGRPAGWCDMIARFWPVFAKPATLSKVGIGADQALVGEPRPSKRRANFAQRVRGRLGDRSLAYT